MVTDDPCLGRKEHDPRGNGVNHVMPVEWSEMVTDTTCLGRKRRIPECSGEHRTVPLEGV